MKGLKVVLIIAALGFCSSSFASGGSIDCTSRHQGGLFSNTTVKRTIKPTKQYRKYRSTVKLDAESAGVKKATSKKNSTRHLASVNI